MWTCKFCHKELDIVAGQRGNHSRWCKENPNRDNWNKQRHNESNECKFCSRSISNVGSLSAHEKYCKSNPNKIDYPRSPNAGVKKGTPSPLKGTKVGRLKIWDDKYPLEEVLVENSTYRRQSVKSRILSNDLIEYRCEICKIGPEWQGKPMPLILDHINGINNDNRLENLRFVCSNCDTQLPTYKSKNIKNKKLGE